jgi:hypothetical protein
MSDDDENNEIVQVTSQRPAFASPNFVIEKDGRLYVTLALIEYDPKASGLSAEQKRGVKQMQKLFDEANRKGSLRAAQLDAEFSRTGPINSGPINSRPGRPRGGK